MSGCEVKVKLYRQINGAKEIRGTLLSFENGNLSLNVSDEDITLSKGDYSSVRLADFD
jgi:ribosome maturation factor RimP